MAITRFYFDFFLRLSSFQRTIKKSFERIVLSKLNKQVTRQRFISPQGLHIP